MKLAVSINIRMQKEIIMLKSMNKILNFLFTRKNMDEIELATSKNTDAIMIKT